MVSPRWRRVLAPIFLSLLLFLTACASEPSRYSQVQKDTARRGAPAAVAKTAEQGATFNKFFPGSTGTYDVVPAQEKKGFAEYKVNQDGKTVAMLSINDTSSLPTAAAKYSNSTEQIAGYPAIDQGAMATGLLVNGRYQVKVLSRNPSFTKDDRVAWLQKFDLRALAKLEPAAEAPRATLVPQLPSASEPRIPVPGSPTKLSPQPAT